MTTSPKQKLSFKEAVKKVFVENYCNFKGRACRSELWWALLATSVGAIVFYVFTTIGMFMKLQHLPGANIVWIITLAIFGIFCLAVFLPITGVMVRRLHDVGKSGKLIIYLYIACIAKIALFTAIMYTHDVRSLMIPNILISLGLFVYAIYLTVLYTKDSEPGTNKWGDSPKYTQGV